MSTIPECINEIRELDGYVSETAYVPGFGDSGVSTDMSNVVVVDNLPIIPESKVAKLLEFVKKIFSTFGELDEASGINMPFNKETGNSEGFSFVVYKTTDAATRAVAQGNNYDFDKAHKLTVIRYDMFQEYLRTPDTFVAPVPVTLPRENDRFYWMLDEHLRDQFVLRWSSSEKNTITDGGGRIGGGVSEQSHETHVMWSENRGAPVLDYGGEKQQASGSFWTTSTVEWSPHGTYLTTLHIQGAKLWFGKGFREGLKLAHQHVNTVLWSPDESYLATWNGSTRIDPISAREALIVWDAVTGERIRAFPQRGIQDADVTFSWSADGKYLARIETELEADLIRVYEAPRFNLLDNRSTNAPGARDLSWCPKRRNLLAYWTPARGNAATTVCVMRIPSKEIVATKPMQQVDSVQMSWHPQGDFLAVIAEKLTRGQARKKKTTGEVVVAAAGKALPPSFTIEIFRLKAKDFPFETVSVEKRVNGFAWEPIGNRFALSLGDTATRSTVAFYSIPEKSVPVHLFNVEEVTLNSLHWSPRGEFIVFAGLQTHQGYLEFYDVERRKSLSKVSHDSANGIQWDPSGRLVATTKVQSLSGPVSTRDTVSNGYTLWTFQGNRVHEVVKPKVYQFIWRPRCDDLLTDEESKEVAKNLKKYIQKYQGEDKMRRERTDLLARLRKRKQRDDFRSFLAQRDADWMNNRSMRIDMGIENGEAPAVISYEDVYEVPISEEVTIVE